MIRPHSPTAIRINAATIEGRTAAMLRAELLDAMACADRLTGPAKLRFHQLVGKAHQRLDVGGVGLAAIIADSRSRTYQPCADGTPAALIIPVREEPNAYGAELVDLLAWLPKAGMVYTRLGIADVLGWDHLSPITPDGPITVHSDPGSWCRAGGNGVVLVNPARAYHSLGHVPKLVAADTVASRRLRAALQPPSPRVPQVLTQTDEMGVAA